MPSLKSPRILPAAAGLLLIGALVGLVGRAFWREDHVAPDVAGTTPAGEANRVAITARIVEIDAVRGRAAVVLEFTPHGRFDAGDGLLAVPLEVDVSDVGGDEFSFGAGKRMFSHQVEIGFREGTAADYPFDRHHGRLELLVLEHPPGEEAGELRRVPAVLEFTPAHHGFRIVDSALPGAAHGYVGFDFEVTRSPLVIGCAVFCLAIMWALTLINLVLLWAVLIGRLEVDLTLFGYMSGMIVALYFFRQVLPDAPPFLGVAADYYAFFWSELITAAVSLAFAAIWCRDIARRRQSA